MWSKIEAFAYKQKAEETKEKLYVLTGNKKVLCYLAFKIVKDRN